MAIYNLILISFHVVVNIVSYNAHFKSVEVAGLKSTFQNHFQHLALTAVNTFQITILIISLLGIDKDNKSPFFSP